MTDLAEFLLARIAEDEVVAREWPNDAPPPPNGDRLWIDALGHPIYQPRARVLAECKAKRRIVKELAATRGLVAALIPGGSGRLATLNGLDAALRALALPYADHPSYREEWRP